MFASFGLLVVVCVATGFARDGNIAAATGHGDRLGVVVADRTQVDDARLAIGIRLAAEVRKMRCTC
jgi:hypothetical protein